MVGRVNPLAPVDRLFDWVTSRSLDADKCLVKNGGDRGMRSVLRQLVLLRLPVFFAILIPVSGNWLDPFWNGVLLSILGSVWVMSPLKRGLAYRNGWLDGRRHMAHSLHGHPSAREWLASMQTYDLVHVLGLPPAVPDDAAGLDDD
jgi:hypothetical protein